MSRSEDLNALAEEIATSYERRRTAIATIRNDTHELLERYHRERVQMAHDLWDALAAYEKDRKAKFQDMMTRIRGEIADIKHETHEMMAGYAEESRLSHEIWVNLTRRMAALRAESRNPESGTGANKEQEAKAQEEPAREE